MAGPIDITDPARLGADEVTTVATEISVPSVGVHLDDRYMFNCQLVPLPGFDPSGPVKSIVELPLPPYGPSPT